MAFYAILWVWARRLPIGARFVTAVGLEAAWEVVENTPMVINRYCEATIALDLSGDSVLNSVADIGAMMAGFWLASPAPVALSIGLTIAMELFVGFMICDNLTLNVVMLLYPSTPSSAGRAAPDPASASVRDRPAAIRERIARRACAGQDVDPVRVGLIGETVSPENMRTALTFVRNRS